MPMFHFTLIVDGPDLQDAFVIDSLFEAGCDDAMVGCSDGIQCVDFDREADDFAEALLTAVEDLERVQGVEVVRIADAGLASLSDMAERLGRTREGVRLLVTGARGPGGFPAPVTDPRSRNRLWHWPDVVRWLNERRGEFPEVEDDCVEAMYNAALELRHGRKQLDPSDPITLRQLLAGVVTPS